MPWLWRSNGSESQRTRPDHREDVRVVVFPRVPPFRNVGRGEKGGGGQSGFQRIGVKLRIAQPIPGGKGIRDSYAITVTVPLNAAVSQCWG